MMLCSGAAAQTQRSPSLPAQLPVLLLKKSFRQHPFTSRGRIIAPGRGSSMNVRTCACFPMHFLLLEQVRKKYNSPKGLRSHMPPHPLLSQAGIIKCTVFLHPSFKEAAKLLSQHWYVFYRHELRRKAAAFGVRVTTVASTQNHKVLRVQRQMKRLQHFSAQINAVRAARACCSRF